MSSAGDTATVDVFHSLDKACQNFARCQRPPHALVLVTPLDGIGPDWGRFREESLACSEDGPVRVVRELISGAGHATLVHRRGVPSFGSNVCFGFDLRQFSSAEGYEKLHTGEEEGRVFVSTTRVKH